MKHKVRRLADRFPFRYKPRPKPKVRVEPKWYEVTYYQNGRHVTELKCEDGRVASTCSSTAH